MQNKELLANISCVLFDLDGTLIDTIDLIHRSFDYAVQVVLGKKLKKEELLQNVGRPLLTQMKSFSASRAVELIEAYNKHNLSKHDKHISAYPGVLQTLKWLKHDKHMPIAVVTSKTRHLSLRGLEITGLRGYIDVVVAVEDTDHHKPGPEPVLLALKQLKREASQAIFVGDSPFDIAAGKAAGVATAAALWGPFDRGSLRALGPDLAIESMLDLRRHLG